jgi:hypothetical protein
MFLPRPKTFPNWNSHAQIFQPLGCLHPAKSDICKILRPYSCDNVIYPDDTNVIPGCSKAMPQALVLQNGEEHFINSSSSSTRSSISISGAPLLPSPGRSRHHPQRPQNHAGRVLPRHPAPAPRRCRRNQGNPISAKLTTLPIV